MRFGKRLFSALCVVSGVVLVSASPVSAGSSAAVTNARVLADSCAKQGRDLGCARPHYVYIEDRECDGHASYIRYSMPNAPDKYDKLIDYHCGNIALERNIKTYVQYYKVCEFRPGKNKCTRWLY